MARLVKHLLSLSGTSAWTIRFLKLEIYRALRILVVYHCDIV